jgi:hypothetical protein
MDSDGLAARRGWVRAVRGGVSAGIVLMAVVLSVALAACGAGPVRGDQGALRDGRGHAVAAMSNESSAAFQTKRIFQLGAGRTTRTFTFRERSGVVLRNQLIVRHGVRVVVDARIPDTADLKVWSWASRTDPSLSCRRDGAFDVCTQGEQWCPMPQATWHFRLVKLSGPAGPVRFAYVVGAPPAGFSG